MEIDSNSVHRMRHVGIVLVLFVFTVWGVVRHWPVYGDDLTSSYVACRLLSAGQPSNLYSHDPENFAKVDNPAWISMGKLGGVPRLTAMHPYVQTPFWAEMLRPVCTHTSFPAFYHLFLAAMMLCTSGTVWLVARYWATSLYRPSWLCCICTGLYLSLPFRYSLFLGQTHILFIFATVLALVLADGRRQTIAGVLLAVAIAVKITPLFLVVYWMARGRWRAVVSCALALVGIGLLSLWSPGSAVLRESFATYRELSNVLLLSMNNESLAAWAMACRYPVTALLSWRPFALPFAFKVADIVFSVAAAVVGARADRSTGTAGEGVPYGAVFALIAATLLNPIAWSHYFILLVVPVMLFLDRRRKGGTAGWTVLSVIVFALSLYPTPDAVVGLVHTHAGSAWVPYVVRGDFTSAVLCLVALWTAWRNRPRWHFRSSTITSPAPACLVR